MKGKTGAEMSDRYCSLVKKVALLLVTFIALSIPGIALAFNISTPNSVSSQAYIYISSLNAEQYDPVLRSFRINPKGTFDDSTSFSLDYKARNQKISAAINLRSSGREGGR